MSKKSNGGFACPTRSWLSDPIEQEAKKALIRLSRLTDVKRMCIMPDVHFADPTCVGTVLATDALVYPFIIGADIGCGMISAPFDGLADEVVNQANAEELFRLLRSAVPIKRHQNRDALLSGLEAIEPNRLSHPALATHASRSGLVEFGTLGRGNHFIEFQRDDDGMLWVMIHSGSRTMGPKVQSYHESQRKDFWLDSGTEACRSWLTDMEWCRRYARASRLRMLEALAEAFEARFGIRCMMEAIIGGDHDHVQRETHDGTDYWVHRKGSNHLDGDAPAIIAGSMGTPSFHVKARKCSESMRSCSHGAGRRMPRKLARKRISDDAFARGVEGVLVTPTAISRLKEEAPAAYKDVSAVMRAQKSLVKRIRTLTPILSYKGG